jgi:uncharacterized protein YndB with AHSA1/START domain
MPSEPITASVHVKAAPEIVFEYFTRSEAMVRWMGEWALLDPTADGEFSVDIKGVPVRGRFLEIDHPHRLLISWGHAGSERLPPGASTVEVRLSPDGDGTRVEIVHRDLPQPEARSHPTGWRHFLGQLAVVAGNSGSAAEQHTYTRAARRR